MRAPMKASSSASESTVMWPASASKASEPDHQPPTISTSVIATVRHNAHISFPRRSVVTVGG